MAEIPPLNPLPGTPTGAEPMKKSTGKVQPKKETVRISLPPKPTAAPTIKLPTLPPGGPTGAPSATPATFAPRPAATAAAAPAATAARPGAAPVAAAQQRPASVAQRPSVVTVPSIRPIDKILIFASAVASLAAVGIVAWVFLTLKNSVETFQG